tara:strand:+ start:393 stop:941 length:549 start_codon:yes stop_codon:yes gene_type:complete
MLTLIFIFAYLSISLLTLGDYSFNDINFKTFWKKSFDFKGTIKRRDFWITQGWLFFHAILLVILGIVLSVDITGFGFSSIEIRPYILIPIYAFSVVSLIPSISIQVRRLRDAARNPLWILLGFIPFGAIVPFIFYLSPSKKQKLPMTLQDRLDEVEDLLTEGTIDEEECIYIRKKILTKYFD